MSGLALRLFFAALLLAPVASAELSAGAPQSGAAPAVTVGDAGRDGSLPVGPSVAIYPPQEIHVRFNHGLHVHGMDVSCDECHKTVRGSTSAADALLPSPTECDSCHGSNHANLDRVTPGKDEEGQCTFCHLEDAGSGRSTAIPRPNLVFNHKAHRDRNIGCAQCHGHVERKGLATRMDLPWMQTCTHCHEAPESAREGAAKGACDVCHIRGDGAEKGRIKTQFKSGTLTPPKWLGNAEHTPDFIERHKWVAGTDSALCKTCHSEDECAACHDGRVRPRNIHPNDFLAMHAIESRRGMERCTSCHREQSFCLSCHQRLGITMTGPSDVHSAARIHPPKSVWSDPPMTPSHHGFEAERNLEACVSCHVERDCVVCHGGLGVGGGFNPHPPNFRAGCAHEKARNPRPCMVCHQPGDGVLSQCR